jgi:signal transduction histidine kinase
MDLHDEVGTLITRALLFSQSLKASSPIEETLREALYSLRLYINSMSKNKVKTEALKDEVTYFIMTHFEDKNISTDIRWRFPSDAFISPQVYRNLRMIIFESANNCLKHAQAKTFALHVCYENKKMNVDIFDDGIFDPEKVKNKNGNGLRNILKRVDKLGGTCVFKTSELGGLQISIEIGLT